MTRIFAAFAASLIVTMMSSANPAEAKSGAPQISQEAQSAKAQITDISARRRRFNHRPQVYGPLYRPYGARVYGYEPAYRYDGWSWREHYFVPTVGLFW